MLLLLVKPDLGFFRSLQFTLTRDQKWRAVMAGYVATVKRLKKAGDNRRRDSLARCRDRRPTSTSASSRCASFRKRAS